MLELNEETLNKGFLEFASCALAITKKNRKLVARINFFIVIIF
jgi:hypothetical protein